MKHLSQLLFRFSTLGSKLVNSLSEIKKQLWVVGVECGIGCGMWSTVPPTAFRVKKLFRLIPWPVFCERIWSLDTFAQSHHDR